MDMTARRCITFLKERSEMTITIPQELEHPLNQRAQQQGTTPANAAVELLRQSLQGSAVSDQAEATLSTQQQALAAIVGGKYARLQTAAEPLASDCFAAEKQEERAREERRWSA
jgi:hypothetical protein